MLKRYCLLFLMIICIFLYAQGASAALKIRLDELESGKIHYAFSISNSQFAVLKYSTSMESGNQVIYAENGEFEGDISLSLSEKGGNLKVTVENMRQVELGSNTLSFSAYDSYKAPSGTSYGHVKKITLTEAVDGFDYSFSSSNAVDYLQLYYRSKQESGTVIVHPDENGIFSGHIQTKLTYARTLITVQVKNGKGEMLTSDTVRKGYQAPEAPEQQEGRLSGLTVCIDPGHQENGQMVREPIGPGLEGYTSGTAGMAQGTATQRKESIVALEISMALRDELLLQGANVVMTREQQDIFHTNMERCQIAEDGNADIMLRIHCDNRDDSNKYGINIYAPFHSDYAVAIGNAAEYRYIGELLLDAMKSSVGYDLSSNTGRVNLNDDYVGNNWAKMICFLIETGFMTNPDEDMRLSNPDYQKMLAQGIAQGVYEIAVYRNLIQAE